jgi:hypothetical protein
MTPAERIHALYSDCDRSFRGDLEQHLLNGYVFSTPEFFLMGRAVDSTASMEDINDPSLAFPRDRQDCWLVYAYADIMGSSPRGLVKNVLTMMPYHLPMVAWQRKRHSRLRYYQINQLQKWTQKLFDPLAVPLA